MATPTGLSGEGYFAKWSDSESATEVVGLIEEWSASISVDENEITSFKDGGVEARDFLPSLYDWTVDISGFLSMANTGQDEMFSALKEGTTFQAYLQVDGSGSYYYGDFFLTGDDITNNVDGIADISYSGRGKDKLNKVSA